MSTARTEILGSIARALDGVPSGIGQGELAEVPRAYRRTSDLLPGSSQVIDILIDRLEDYKAHVHQVSSTDDIPAAVRDILSEASSVVRPAGLPESWLSTLPPSTTVTTDAPRPGSQGLSPYELDAIDAVVTASRVSIADTGTIVLDGQSDQGRRAITLVPDTHVCVVLASQVVHLVPEAVALLDEHPERPLTWISGPSATSDIELNRVEGVHGPRNLHVIIVG